MGRRPEWEEVRDFCEKFIGAAQRNLENRSLSEADTQFERGQIAALRSVLTLERPREEFPPDAPVSY
jgi:hypothetical protein